MPDKLDANYGPWSELFSGTWAGYEAHVYENPDRLVLTLIYDRQEGELKGIVTIMNRFYVSETDVSRLAASLGGHSFVLEKNYPTAKARFFSISSGPKYAAAEGLNAGIDAAHQEVEERSDQLSQLSKGFGLVLTDLKHAPGDTASRLFAEPILMAGLVSAVEQAPKIASARVTLGKKNTGEDAEEMAQSFAGTVVIGPSEPRRQAFKVMLENCVLGGVTAFVLDDDASFSAMSVANKGFDYKTYPNLQPIGMPVKQVPLSAAAIDLNVMTSRMLREIVGVPVRDGDYAGKAAMEMIDNIIEENKHREFQQICKPRTTEVAGGVLQEAGEHLNSLDDVEEKLLAAKDESKKFHTYRAIRIVRVIKKALPGMLGGRMDLGPLISSYMKSTGLINRIDTSGLPSNLKKALAYSLLRSLYKKHKEEDNPQLRAMVLLMNGPLFAPVEPAGEIDKGLLEMLVACNGVGMGFCLGAEHGIDLNPEITTQATLRMDFVTEDEIAVRAKDMRPYRAKLRPPLSA